MKRYRIMYFVCFSLFFSGLAQLPTSAEDPIQPPTNAFSNGIPIANMKTMDQLEPRTLISQLPFEVVSPGSYYVVSPLLGVEGSNGIKISCDHVKIDLNGFPLMGVSNSLSGIVVIGPHANISIRDGMVCNWGEFGIDAASAKDVTITDVRAYQNGSGGIYAGDYSFIDRCAAQGNGFLALPTNPPATDGMQIGSYSTVQNSIARANKGANIHCYSHSKILSCTAGESAEANGIWAEEYCTIRGCVTARNFNHGIRIGSRCRVTENTSAENGIQEPATNAAGINVEGNNNFVEKNILVGNDIGIFVPDIPLNPPAGNLLINNAASKNLIDYFILATNNHFGPIEDFNVPQFTNSNPWTNFKFSKY